MLLVTRAGRTATTTLSYHEILNMIDLTYVNILLQRSSGILLPIFSLPCPHGIGDIGPSAHAFLDFLKQSGQSCWQILPLGPTNPLFGNSPYMSSSAFACSPLFISLDVLVEEGLIRKGEIGDHIFSEYSVDYQEVAVFKQRLINLAWERFRTQPLNLTRLKEFVATHPWVHHYGLFEALKKHFHDAPWFTWPDPLRHRESAALADAADFHKSFIDYVVFEQFLITRQWQRLREYANSLGITLVGDLPIYLALDSADVWEHQQLFQLDRHKGLPTHVAGVPPDYFSPTGQRWGNPLYRWDADDPLIVTALWAWWEQRLRHNFTFVDTLRIDHFRGFESYWAVPAEEETALNGCWQPGPGKAFFHAMEQRLGGMSIIAEDLGSITPEVEELRNDLGYPGMNILLFAFDGDPNNSYLPYNIEKKSVVYTGTHDNDTAVGWYLNPDVPQISKQRAKGFANRADDHAGSFHHDIIYLAMGSPANLAILPMQDILGFGNDCRLNVPGTTANNWQWRCAQRFINEEISSWLHEQTTFFGRLPKNKCLCQKTFAGKNPDV